MTKWILGCFLVLGLCGQQFAADDKDIVIDVPIFNFTSSDISDAQLIKAKSVNRVFGCNHVRYPINAPQAGMYALYVAAAGWETHISINDHEVAFTKVAENGMDSLTVGSSTLRQLTNVQLKQGTNTLTFDREIFPGIAYIAAIRLVRNEQPQTRVHGTLTNYRGYYQRGEKQSITLTAEALANRVYEIVVQVDQKDGPSTTMGRVKIMPQSGITEKTLQIPMDFDGMAILRITVDGKDVCRRACVVGFDMQAKPQPSNSADIQQLVAEIDCAKTTPQYHGNGETSVTTHAGMTYRESSDNGVYAQGWKQASWFAYKLDGLQVGQRYRVQVDYPDDKVRTFTVSLIDQSRYGHINGVIPYALDSGVASGAEFANSNTIKSLSMDFNARREDARLMFLNWHAPLRAAVSKIRVYRIPETFPALALAHPAQRHQAMFYEEPDRWFGYFTGLNQSQEQMLVAADRYARWCQAAGFDTIWDTVSIYGTACWPSKILDNAVLRGFLREDNYPTGIVLPMLLTAQRYGLRYIAELHPTDSIVTLPSAEQNPEIYTFDSKGRKLLNPLHPTVQQWGESLVRELAQHAAPSSAFAGVSIRWMGWANSGWASFNSRDAGMDDWTLTQFCKDARLDATLLLKKDSGQRWRWINQNQLKAFDAWKTDHMVTYYRKLLAALRSTRSDLKLYVHRFGNSQDFGFDDISKLAVVDGIELTRSSQGYPPVRRIKDPSLLPAAGVDASMDVENARENSFFSNVYMETDFMLDALELGSAAGQHMRVCGAINPPGRMMLKRYALLLRDEPLPGMLGEGGLGYVQGDMALRQELARAYLPLPKIAYAKLPNDDPVALWQGQHNGKWYLYMVNVSSATVDVSLQSSASQMHELAGDQAVSLLDAIKLPAYAMRSYVSTHQISAMRVQIPIEITQAMEKQLDSAKAIFDLPQLNEPQILDMSPEDYTQAGKHLVEAENALNQDRLFTFEKTLRQGMVHGGERLTGLAKLYAARGQYPIGVYTIDTCKTDVAESDVEQSTPDRIRFIRRIGDMRQVLTNTLDTVKDEQGRNYLLEDDGRIVVQGFNGRYLQTLYTNNTVDQCRSLRIVKGWVMLSSEPSNRAIKPTGATTLQPFADGAMHVLPDGSVGFLFASDRSSSKQIGVYQIAPQISVPKLLGKAPADKRVVDFCVIGQNVLFSGGFQSPGSKQLALISMSLDQAGSKPQLIAGQLGQGDSVNLFGMSPTADAGSIIVRKVNNWTRLDLVKLDLTTNQAVSFFDMQAHLKLKGHENIYNIVKHFPPWELAYRVERYPDGSGYALLVSPLCTVYCLDAQGNVKWATGVKAEGSGRHREWSYPADISVDHKGRLWVVDRDTSQIDMMDASGQLLASFGKPGRLDDNANDAFWQPQGIAVTTDAQGRDILYVGDTGNGRMVEFEIR